MTLVAVDLQPSIVRRESRQRGYPSRLIIKRAAELLEIADLYILATAIVQKLKLKRNIHYLRGVVNINFPDKS